MIDLIHGAELGGIVVLLLCALWGVRKLRAIHAHVESIGAYRPTEATPSMVKYWRAQMARYQPGTPKHDAYKQRLIEAGEIDGD